MSTKLDFQLKTAGISKTFKSYRSSKMLPNAKCSFFPLIQGLFGND